MNDYVPPEHRKSAFNCPHCGAYSRQEWTQRIRADDRLIEDLSMAYCDNCHKYSIWLGGKMIYPNESVAPLPSPDMPEDVLSDYNEARDILEKSPRASAALLRLSIQKLCVVLGEKGENINDDIASLVLKGLPEKIQKALDTVRVIGNNAVHPGVIDLKDNPSIALSLFKLVNMVIDTMITQPKEVSGLFNSLPEESKKAIEKRDKK
jgi:hypothetical protein